MMEVTGGVDKVTWERSAHRAAEMLSVKFPVITVIAGMFIPSGLELQWKQESSPRGALGAVSHVLTPHYGDETPESRAQTPGPHLSWAKAGTSTAVERTPLPASPPEGSLPHLPSLRGSLGPLDRGLLPLAKRGVGVQSHTSGGAADTCRVHASPAGGPKTSWKETNDWVSSASVDAHLQAMIPTSHLTVIFQLIVI